MILEISKSNLSDKYLVPYAVDRNTRTNIANSDHMKTLKWLSKFTGNFRVEIEVALEY